LRHRASPLVPTLINIDTFPSIAATAEEKVPWGMPPTCGISTLADTRRVGAAREAGIPIYVGTDAGGTIAHGLAVDEMEELVTAGFSPVEALDAGAWAARAWLRHPGLEEGADADLLVLDGDPRLDLSALRAPRAIVLRGRTVS
jgi:Imidazolonepropionase and related amidohydrolases